MPKFLATIILLLVIAAAAFWLFMPRDALPPTLSEPASTVAPVPGPADPRPVIRDDPMPDTPVTPEPSPTTAAADADDARVPPPASLDLSDPVLLTVVNQLSPELSAWLLPDEQIRKWVVLVNLLADGKVPVKNRPLEYPLPPFQVHKEGETLWMDRGNYRRASVLIKALTQMPPSRVARHYEAWLPLLQTAQDELGNGHRFEQRLQQAIDRIMAAQPLTGDIELKAGVLKYTYADPAREQASALEKALWRLGPSNTLRIQNYLRDLRPLL